VYVPAFEKEEVGPLLQPMAQQHTTLGASLPANGGKKKKLIKIKGLVKLFTQATSWVERPFKLDLFYSQLHHLQ